MIGRLVIHLALRPSRLAAADRRDVRMLGTVAAGAMPRFTLLSRFTLLAWLALLARFAFTARLAAAAPGTVA